MFSGPTAGYQFHALSGEDFQGLSDDAREFGSVLVMLIGLLGAGLALCSGALFWLAFFRGVRLAFFAALIGGTLGLAGLLTIHLEQRAWVLFIIDNVCLNMIGIGFTIAGREILDFALARNKQG